MYHNPALLNILELTPPVTAVEIKKAYRSLALKYHPDKNPDGAGRFLEIKSAYDALLSLPDAESATGPCECQECLFALFMSHLLSLPLSLQAFFKVHPREEINVVGVVRTARGKRLLVTAPPTEHFWRYWRQDKNFIRAYGISASKNLEDVWQICFWIPWGETT